MNYDLIIVGMGPVGATAANLAGLWGLKTLVLDKSEKVYENPRAMGFDHEAMRIFDNIGLAEAIKEYVMPYRASRYLNKDGKVLKQIDASKPPYSLGWAPNYVFSQPPLERELRANIGAFEHVDVQLGTEVLSVDNQSEGIRIRVRYPDGSEQSIDARYVFACDGGSSPTRTSLGLRMDDLDFDEPWLVVDVLLKEGKGESLPETNVQYCEVERPSTFVVGPGRHRRWEFMINEDETPEGISRPEIIQRLISRWLDPTDYDIWRASTYRFHALVLEQWRAGNIFMLGDAAHMTPPFLAQGMCQGIRDAANLTWKVAMVRRGLANDSLLGTYQSEREPHVRRTTELAKEFGMIICERNESRAAKRDSGLLEQMKKQPGGTVRQSLIPGLNAGMVDYQAPAGELFPQPKVFDASGQEGLLDTFTGQSFRIVIASDFGTDELLEDLLLRVENSALPFSIVRLVEDFGSSTKHLRYSFKEVDGLLSDWLEKRGCNVMIARPDHYVFGGAETKEEALLLLDRCLTSLNV